MMRQHLRTIATGLIVLACAAGAGAKDVKRFAVNEYLGMTYDRQPVSCDVTFDEPVPAGKIGLRPGPCQVEIVEGTPQAVRRARVWTMVTFRPNTYALDDGDVRDWPGLAAKINAELQADGASIGKCIRRSLAKALGLPADFTALPAREPDEAQRSAILRAANEFITRNPSWDAAWARSLGLDAAFADVLKKLSERKADAGEVQKLNRAGLDAAWKGLVRPLKLHPRHLIFTVHTDGPPPEAQRSAAVVADAGEVGGVKVAAVGNGIIHAKLPVGTVAFDVPASAFDVPGPVVSISRDGAEWIGSGYLQAMSRVRGVTCRTSRGPVYFESRIHYAFEDGTFYKVRARLYAAKPYVHLVEDFNLSGDARYVFNYDDWFTDAFFSMGDNRLYGWRSIRLDDPCSDFVKIPGQKALTRLVVWSQFNYFGGKQETIGLKSPDPDALAEAYQDAKARHEQDVQRYEENVARQDKAQADYAAAMKAYPKLLKDYEQQLAAHKKDPKKVPRPRQPKEPQEPRARRYSRPREPDSQDYVYAEEPYSLAGASIRTTKTDTPPGKGLAVGAFYVRPDLWTRAKFNHVDLYMRPEVPGDRHTRGVSGLAGARLRIAMEAWLIDPVGTGAHREWAIFAVPAADRAYLAKAHVVEGAWPLDRLIRTTLVWNSDGSPVRLEDTAPPDFGHAGGADGVFKGTQGRSGLQCFNGSNGGIRWCPPLAGFDGKVTPHRAAAGSQDNLAMANQAIRWYAAGDESAYPGVRASMPWSDPEALNPFYQGMENMNFSADLYRYMAGHAVYLMEMGHPDGRKMLAESEKRFDMALDRYVYPGSGCWEESHGYAGHTIGITGPLSVILRNSGMRNFLEDIRFARMMEFFLYVHSPVDAEWGNRVVPAVGDHGQGRAGPEKRLRNIIAVFAGSKDPRIRQIVRRAAWMIREDGGSVPEGIEPEKADLSSRFLRGYGTILRAVTDRPTSFALALRGAIAAAADKGKPPARHDLNIRLSTDAEGALRKSFTGWARSYNQGLATGEAALADGARLDEQGPAEVGLNVTLADDKWVKGGSGRYRLKLALRAGAVTGSFTGTWAGREVSGEVTGQAGPAESFLVLRAGQSWGHHHADKGSMWFWGRNVHFFGDCSWGGPPGGTYWNQYKQGPASGTQIELLGINNWTLPCKYPAPWIDDEEYGGTYDYVNARCLYPYNPPPDLGRSSPVALRNGYDRQVLFVHPDLLIVRDNLETNCKAIWRLHSFQPAGTTVKGNTATLASAAGVVGDLAIVYPKGPWKSDVLAETASGRSYLALREHARRPGAEVLRVIDRDILNTKYSDAGGKPAPFEELPRFGGSVELRWDMPDNTSATWIFGVRDAAQAAPQWELLDDEGRVVRVKLPGGLDVIALLNIEPFTYTGCGIEFEGTVGLVVRRKDKTVAHGIRAVRLKAD